MDHYPLFVKGERAVLNFSETLALLSLLIALLRLIVAILQLKQK